MIKVVAIDPGVTTGYAVGLIAKTNKYVRATVSDEIEEVPDYDQPMVVGNGEVKYKHLAFYDWLRQQGADIIICESFEYRPGLVTHSDIIELFSRELIGIIHLVVEKEKFNRNVELYMQKPAEAVGKTPYFTDNKLKELGVYSVAHKHGNDATRHLLQWYTFKSGYKYNKAGVVPA